MHTLHMHMHALHMHKHAHMHLRQVIYDSVRGKAEVVAADEREAGLRGTLNWGHTVRHATPPPHGLDGDGTLPVTRSGNTPPLLMYGAC